MATQEFYIRNASETEARGPFTQDQLSSLAEAGQLDSETLYYEATTEEWVTIGSNAPLKAALFPEKRKLTIKTKVQVNSLNKPSETAAPITVDDMLAAAEGKTAETKDKVDPQFAMERAAKLGLYAATGALAISAAALSLPAIDVLTSLNVAKIVAQPLAILGVLDLVLALLLALQMVSIYPFVRFRAALGIGLLGFIYWTEGRNLPLLAVLIGSIGLYFCTIFTQLASVGIAALLALSGMAGLAYVVLT